MGKTILEEFNLKGTVKTVTYEYEGGSHKLYFDENGRLIKQENTYSHEGIRGEVYDNYLYENGRLQSFEVFRVFEKIPTLFIGKVWFEYDPSGLLISSDSYLHDDKTIYKYDEKGNRIERYGRLKTRQKFNAKGQVTEEWAFDDKEGEVREFGVTDAQGNHLPDSIYVMPPYELPSKKYEHNESGDVISITYMKHSEPVTDAITLAYDSAGNWIERTAHGDSIFYDYLTTEHIYTHHTFYGLQHIRRTIEYYE